MQVKFCDMDFIANPPIRIHEVDKDYPIPRKGDVITFDWKQEWAVDKVIWGYDPVPAYNIPTVIILVKRQ